MVFLITVTKMYDQRTEESLWLLVWGAIVHHGGRNHMVVECEEGGVILHPHTISGNREKWVWSSTHFLFFSCFTTAWDSNPWNSIAHLEEARLSQRHTQNYVPQMILIPIKLMSKTTRYTGLYKIKTAKSLESKRLSTNAMVLELA